LETRVDWWTTEHSAALGVWVGGLATACAVLVALLQIRADRRQFVGQIKADRESRILEVKRQTYAVSLSYWQERVRAALSTEGEDYQRHETDTAAVAASMAEFIGTKKVRTVSEQLRKALVYYHEHREGDPVKLGEQREELRTRVKELRRMMVDEVGERDLGLLPQAGRRSSRDSRAGVQEALDQAGLPEMSASEYMEAGQD
jgi:hypothetical protein